MIVNDYKPAYVLYRQYPQNKDFELNKPFELEKWPGGFHIVFKDCQGERHYSEEFFKKYPYLFMTLSEYKLLPEENKTLMLENQELLKEHAELLKEKAELESHLKQNSAKPPKDI